MTVYCIDCDHPIKLEFQPAEGEILVCARCGTAMEVICLEPVELDWVYLEPSQSENGWGGWTATQG